MLDVNESDFDNNKATIAYHEIQASVNFTVNKDEIFTTLKGYNIANLIAKVYESELYNIVLILWGILLGESE